MYPEQLLVRVSELYYMQKLNQSEISKIIGISRPSISRILEEARNSGIVRISIQTPIKKNAELSEQIRNSFHLRDAIVVSHGDDYTTRQSFVGKAAADYVSGLLKDSISIGISWGTNVRQFIAHFSEDFYYTESKIIQLHGSLGGADPELDGDSFVWNLSRKIGGQPFVLSAPGYVSSPEFQEELCSLHQIQSILQMGKSVDIAVNGLGSISLERNSLVKTGYLNTEQISLMVKSGAVGQLLGRLYSLDGVEINAENLFPISTSLDSLRKIPFSIGLAVSKARAEATYGALIAKYINVLFCDEELAIALLKQNK